MWDFMWESVWEAERFSQPAIDRSVISRFGILAGVKVKVSKGAESQVNRWKVYVHSGAFSPRGLDLTLRPSNIHISLVNTQLFATQ